jgi:RNA polymerase sigma-70 factor (ECF subfamily)
LWDGALIARGEAMLRTAHGFGRPGRFQYEAAIQSAHCSRAHTGRTDWAALRTLHRGLQQVAPTLGGAVALAAVDGEVDGPDAGLAALDAIADPAMARFQPAWTTRGHLLARAGRVPAAAGAYRRAIELTGDDGVRRYLLARLHKLTEQPG